MSLQVAAGDKATIPISLTVNNETFVISPGAIVKAALVNGNERHRTMLSSEAVTVDFGASGTDLSVSKIIASFDEQETATWPTGNYFFEIQVDDGGKVTWFYPVKIISGAIS